jgi:hypothetical protein
MRDPTRVIVREKALIPVGSSVTAREVVMQWLIMMSFTARGLQEGGILAAQSPAASIDVLAEQALLALEPF